MADHGERLAVELRGEGDDRELVAWFPYGREGVFRATGRREIILADAFYPPADGRPVYLLADHLAAKPLAATDGYLKVDYRPDGVEATVAVSSLPDTTAARDTLAEIARGLKVGVSPGFNKAVVARGGPGADRVKRAELAELSIVTAPVYAAAGAELRDTGGAPPESGSSFPSGGLARRRPYRWWM